ncbi:MAG: DEAD/DEAH box helicase [Vallitaleaceae bacterium]|nr:DEAD/DEAH box helicase [Vallitaleaceae bacterium]
MNFFRNECQLDELIMKALKRYGYHEPMEIQKEVIPAVLAGQDLIVQSETGSGKTAAFGIPLVQSIDLDVEEVQVLVLTPTRELAVQVSDEINKIGLYKELRSVPFYGKQPMHIQLRHLKNGVHIAVGTPGRVADLIERGALTLEKIHYLVIDEADELLRRGFLAETVGILQKLPNDRVTLLFSATMPEEIGEICKQYLKNPKRIEQLSKSDTREIQQTWLEVSEDWKYLVLTKVLEHKNPDSCMIFCNTRAKADRLLEKMKQAGYPCQILHGGMEQRERLQAMTAFKHKKVPILITTDIAARGIHINELDLVINYSIPQEAESYVHRIGRTGRAGKSGEAISFVSEYEKAKWLEIIDLLGYKVARKDKAIYLDDAVASKEASGKEIAHKAKQGKNVDTKISYKKSTNTDKIQINLGSDMKIKVKDLLYLLKGISGVVQEDIGNIEIMVDKSLIEINPNKADYILQELKKVRYKGKAIITKKISER